ncbi:hypothetical protein TrLO_g11497 [Triparma laevis f. longispina]|uniref:Transmembrane protein 107 n=1 Tax=Triparma laevis f. longispina TaxID=1714387 RepID=A0A9W7C9V9_9STRA|nr:hypothetical protein TrLO_g11497 [Triparma laevis f. longispina]
MGGNGNGLLIPARFLVTIGHLVAIIMIQSTMKSNVYASLGIVETDAYLSQHGNFPHGAAFPLDASERSAVDSINNALIVSYTCFAFDLLGMIGGFTLFFSQVNLLQIVIHFIGGVYTSWFIAYGWKWQSLWYIVGFTNVTTAVVEIVMLLAIFAFKIVIY